MHLPLDIVRLLDDRAALIQIVASEDAGSEAAYRRARGWLADAMAEVGLNTHTDAAANLIGERPGSAAMPPIILGGQCQRGERDQHCLTGLVASLAIARALQQADVQLQHPLQLIDFFLGTPGNVRCPVGAQAWAGGLPTAALSQPDRWGSTLGAAMARWGGQPERLGQGGPPTVHAYLELYTEQQHMLAHKGAPIGVVVEGACERRAEIALQGPACPLTLLHALRAGRASAIDVELVESADTTRLAIAIRSAPQRVLEQLWSHVRRTVLALCDAANVGVEVTAMEDTPVLRPPAWIVHQVWQACRTVSVDAARLVGVDVCSGAWIGRSVPAGAIAIRQQPDGTPADNDALLGVIALSRSLLAIDKTGP